MHYKVGHDGAADVGREENVERDDKLPATSKSEVLLVGGPLDLHNLVLLVLDDTTGYLPLSLSDLMSWCRYDFIFYIRRLLCSFIDNPSTHSCETVAGDRSDRIN